jgi:two-component system NtrC family sensor kinase
MQCPRCHQGNPRAANFCLKCALPLKGASSADPNLNGEVESLRRALNEAREQQTATSEILRVISSSHTDAHPVFEAIVRSAVRLCDARLGALMMVRNGLVHLEAQCNNTEQWIDVARNVYPIPLEKSAVRLALEERQVLHFPDIDAEGVPDTVRALARAGGYRTALLVPIMKDGVGLGAIGVGKAEPFSDPQIDLLKTFAAEAVIAIENVRLFKEREAHNHQLTEALDQQTATSEILRVISRAHSDAQLVFDTIVQNAVRLCNAAHAAVFRTDGKTVYQPANYGSAPQALVAQRVPSAAGPGDHAGNRNTEPLSCPDPGHRGSLDNCIRAAKWTTARLPERSRGASAAGG